MRKLIEKEKESKQLLNDTVSDVVMKEPTMSLSIRCMLIS